MSEQHTAPTHIAASSAHAPLALSTNWPIVVTAYLDAALDSPQTRRAYTRHPRDAFAALGVATIAERIGPRIVGYSAGYAGSSLS